jgi:oxygen-independent coproporphyrinogen-3 oxidase
MSAFDPKRTSADSSVAFDSPRYRIDLYQNAPGQLVHYQRRAINGLVRMQPDLLEHLERRIPRYTSYPTAAQFRSDISANVYEAWLAALPADEAISIYLHVPFCAELCLYCGCHTTVARGYTPVAAYVDLLQREISLVGQVTGRHKVNHVHWGGGTPNIVKSQDFLRVMAGIEARFGFTSQTELAIEIDPRTLTREQVTALAQAGVTRASLGVQDFEPRVQAAVGRIQSFDQTSRAIDWLRDVGIESINLDLMYGLPHQTVSTVIATAKRALALAPDRIALFGYAHVPWMKRHQRLISISTLPGSSDRLAQGRAAADVFIAAAYIPIGLDHFAKKGDLLACRQREGRLHRNFQGYTTDESGTIIGFGTSAIGTLAQGYVQNAAATLQYQDAINRGWLATSREYQLTDEDRFRWHIIERLMCDLYVDLADACRMHDRNLTDLTSELAQLDQLVRQGIIERAGAIVRLSSPTPFIRIVCAVFDKHSLSGEPRYSLAS